MSSFSIIRATIAVVLRIFFSRYFSEQIERMPESVGAPIVRSLYNSRDEDFLEPL
jgi:hypothetical protein